MAEVMDQLPTSRQFVASLISALDKPAVATANPLTDTATCKERLLTIHVLFQNELLPALDLLDRSLVTRLRLDRPGAVEGTTMPNDAESNSMTTGQCRNQEAPAIRSASTYYVRSAQQQQQSSRNTSSRYRNASYEQTTYYEVRLNAWSCSCPAFAFSAFPVTSPEGQIPRRKSTDVPESSSWTFGGLSQGTDMPICKHLLACTLVEHSSMFEDMVEERIVSAEQLAGWAAGWGD
ncbi:hypothetical protein LTR56_000507 [Elasticomyces elasticus]|nr:hypothetical protein LTR22_014235 [Elasticomyces elasticus]KAK3660749.1 hypothetical protein LTR56_000507 [Elasticomyces elasticus]KAK4922895.1 hypothetical protein LTR49_009902 [Elasticomyces elasticus]KAK5759729.1 hypothetical protein LTS12_010069 [Elasticomyces elasticus]